MSCCADNDEKLTLLASGTSRPLLSSLPLTLIVIAVAWCSLLYPPIPVLTLMADSEQYWAMSQSLLNASFLDPVDISNVPHLATVMRPPLFPLLLTITGLLPGVSPSSALIALHLCLALVALVVTPFALRSVAPQLFTALAAGVALYSGKQVLWAEMSEWLALCCLLGATASYLLWCHERRTSCAFATSLFIALAILTRTALIPWLLIPPLLIVQAPRAARRGTLFVVLLGILPLALWGLIQSHRLGTFSLGAYEGLNAVATARSLGEIPVVSTDSPETNLVLSRLQTRGTTVSDRGLLPQNVHQWDGELYGAFHHNFDEVCSAVQSLPPGSQLPTMDVVRRSFMAHHLRYISFLEGGVATFLSECAPLLALCITTGSWLLLRCPRSRALAQANVTISLLATIYVASIFLSILWLDRYFVPVQGSILFLTILSLLTLVKGVRDGLET